MRGPGVDYFRTRCLCCSLLIGLGLGLASAKAWADGARSPPGEFRAELPRPVTGSVAVGILDPDAPDPGSSIQVGVLAGWGDFRLGLRLGYLRHHATIQSEPPRLLEMLTPGLTLEWLSLGGRTRTCLSLGPAVLLRWPARLGLVTRAGAFLDVEPLGLRFPLGPRWLVGVDPLGVRLLASDLSAVPLFDTQFHTTLRVELSP